jgi:hypothetical protein
MKKICFYLVATLAISAVLIAGISSGALVRPTATVSIPPYLKLLVTDDTGKNPLPNTYITLQYTTAARAPYKIVSIQGITDSRGEFVIPGSYFSGLSVRPGQELKGAIIKQGYVPLVETGGIVSRSNWAAIPINPRPRTVKIKFKRALIYAPPAGTETVEREISIVSKDTGLLVTGALVQVRLHSTAVSEDTIIEGFTGYLRPFKYRVPRTTPPIRNTFSIAKPDTFGYVEGGLGSAPESNDPTNAYHPSNTQVDKYICRLEKFTKIIVVE